MVRRILLPLAGCLLLIAAAGTASAGAAAPLAATGWVGSYFPNTTLSGQPALVRDDGATLGFIWPGSPAPTLPADYFSARWTRTLALNGGSYAFTFRHDDGGRLVVDGTVVLEEWYMQVPTSYSVTLPLAAGPHTVVVEYYTTWGLATVQLDVVQVGPAPAPTATVTPSPVPAAPPTPTATAIAPGGDDEALPPTPTQVALPTATATSVTPPTATASPAPSTATATPVPPTATPTPQPPPASATPAPATGALAVSALVGDYFNNTTLTPPDVLKRDDGRLLDMRWPASPAPGVNPDNFSVRWGQIIASGGGTYQFVLTHDDGARLWLDGQLLADDWAARPPVARTLAVTLTPGQHLLKLEYYHTWGGAVVSLALRMADGSPAAVVPLGAPAPTVTPTATPLPPTPTVTPTATPLPPTPTVTPSATAVAPTLTPGADVTVTDPAATPTATASATPLPAQPAPTATPTASATATSPAASPTATGTAVPSPTATPLPGTRDKTLWPFASSSIWNTPIGTGAAYVPARIRPRTWMTVDDEYLFFSPPGDPAVPFYTNGIWGSGRCTASLFRFMVNLPASFVLPDARVGWTPNAPAAVLAPDGITLHQMSPIARCSAGGPLTAGWVSQDQSIYGDGIRGGHGGSGLSTLGGSVRLGELTGGAPIRHALKVNLWGSQALSPASGGYRWPAVRADAYYNGGGPNAYNGAVPQLRMGSLLAIPAGIDLNALGLTTAPARKLAWTLQNYGAYVVDDTAWDANALSVQTGVRTEFRAAFGMGIEGTTGPWHDDLVRLFSALSVVDNNTPGSVGGGGAPLQPLAPPIGN